ncbi:peptidoglycan-binding domain-containing protein [Limimaricola pyoseonensis]|uniref:Putative peptidoglycan binding domain-containing protein n=1 Tax=Limimaricola pyoseonensis TaxID=521013 RepID=A0A1G7GZK7_9RHOB|nr:peptidoglycan-binding domain-containing protein [Limimaricola pyoseonensis]SDE93610.1 Putative peptidoglycan binding domain-containing protein [Limimaricola pyoseonensis]
MISAYCFAAALAASVAVTAPGAQAALGMEPPEVARAQLLLDHLGYDPGDIDGREGPRLAAAIAAYQRDHGMAVTGRLDRALAHRLLDHVARQPSQALRATAPPRMGFHQRFAWPSRMGGW